MTYWQGLATAYGSLGPPLRPSVDDLHFLQATTAEWARSSARERMDCTLLGVTPDIAGMAWPVPTRLVAVDRSVPMMETVWPGDIGGRKGVLGDWFTLPHASGSRDVVMGDGSLNCVAYPDGLRRVAEEVKRVLRPEGLFLPRCYVQPDAREKPEHVMNDLFTGQIPTFHHFKFRLLMAMQDDARWGVGVSEVYRFWADWNVDIPELAAKTGWDLRSIEMMVLYRDAETVHTFPSRDEFLTVLDEYFELIREWAPVSCMGERCPTWVMRPRNAA